MSSRTIIDKIWDAHVVRAETLDTPGIVYVDLHLIHEVTTPQAFTELRARGLAVRCPQKVLATLDHSTPTLPAAADGTRAYTTPEAENQVHQLETNCREFGIELNGWDSPHRGIVHVIRNCPAGRRGLLGPVYLRASFAALKSKTAPREERRIELYVASSAQYPQDAQFICTGA
jgi:homoaconitase/3-isopropylmalate dehydratase large subunit